MIRTILYPFRCNADYRIGYAWSAELSRRLKAKFSLFTTMPLVSDEAIGEIYTTLAEAQGFYVKNFQLLPLKLGPVRSDRNFLEGEFNTAFFDFIRMRQPNLIVLQSDLLSNSMMKQVIESGSKVIVLSTDELIKMPLSGKDRAELFVSILQRAACYNIPASAFSAIGRDAGLFNSIASFFKKKSKPMEGREGH